MINFTFFGTSTFSVYVLDALLKRGFIPTHIVTTPDKPQGRKLIITPPPVKLWAEARAIPYIQPATLREKNTEGVQHASQDIINTLTQYNSDVFIVASYGKIIPDTILNIPQHNTLNVHPSLLPAFRGASPLQSSILDPETTQTGTGITIIHLDAEMDHGPIVAQEHVEITPWPPRYTELEKTLGEHGGTLLATILPDWISGSITEREQDHLKATYTKKIEKADGEINLSDDPHLNIRKIRAFEVWPGTYFFATKHRDGQKVRVLIKDARITQDGSLEITRVVPEGKSEMDYRDFLKGL